MLELTALQQGGGTGGLAFFDTIYKAATLPASWEAPQRDLNPGSAATPRPLPNEGGLVATMSDLHHEQHTARPELYVPKARRSLCSVLFLGMLRQVLPVLLIMHSIKINQHNFRLQGLGTHQMIN